MDFPAVGYYNSHTLAAVMGTAAAERYDGVATVVPVCLQAVGNIQVGRIGLGAVINYGLQTGILDALLDGAGNTGLGQAFIGNDEGFFRSVNL